LNCAVSPAATVAPALLTAMDATAAGPTVSVADPLTPFEVAVMRAVPCAFVVASPEASTVAMVGLAEVQVTDLVMSAVLESE
jgi:hypothetical protein